MSNKFYRKETEKALKNFPFTTSRVHLELIYALSEIKQAAALTNKKIGHFSPDIADAIIQSCEELRQGMFNSQFILPALQGGAGTSINMNVNEVIASRSEEILVENQKPQPVHPNDHVNRSQSTNDVNPSALKIVSIRLTNKIVASVDILISSLEEKSEQYGHFLKLGRTHLQDAVPITIKEEFDSYIDTIKRGKRKLEQFLPYLYELNLGGTAVGNSINAPVEYRRHIYEELRQITKLPLIPADNFMSQTSSQTDFLGLIQHVVCLCLDISKIANDLRLLSSGPLGGLGEITLEELQAGSSIMPGKINPVLPETINQLFFMVSGDATTIEHAAHASQLELGVMFPILADRLISSLKTTAGVLYQFSEHCIKTLVVNEDACTFHLEHSMAFATLLTPILGYDAVSAVVKEAKSTKKTLRQVVMDKQLLSEERFSQIIHTKCLKNRKDTTL